MPGIDRGLKPGTRSSIQNISGSSQGLAPGWVIEWGGCRPTKHMPRGPLNRRDFISCLGGAAAWPLRTRAEQVTRPAVGFLNSASADKYAYLAASFRQGLSDLGFVDGQNITIEYRWAASQYDRLSADHDSGVLSIRPLGSTNQYSLVSGLPASRACTHLVW